MHVFIMCNLYYSAHDQGPLHIIQELLYCFLFLILLFCLVKYGKLVSYDPCMGLNTEIIFVYAKISLHIMTFSVPLHSEESSGTGVY